LKRIRRGTYPTPTMIAIPAWTDADWQAPAGP